MEYCEERRVAWARKEEEDEARKRDAKRKEDHWRLLRESVTFLRENDDKWHRRRIKEVANLKEEEKRDRLAICKEKKKKYGIKSMNKEESRRLKERTEERMMISEAKANYWKKYRSGGDGVEEDKHAKEWRKLKEGVISLEEKGGWI